MEEIVPDLEYIVINGKFYCVSDPESESESEWENIPSTSKIPDPTPTVGKEDQSQINSSDRFKAAYLSWLSLEKINPPIVFGSVNVRNFCNANQIINLNNFRMLDSDVDFQIL